MVYNMVMGINLLGHVVRGLLWSPPPTDEINNAVLVELDAKKEPMSSTDTGPNDNGRWGIRTHDPLIKSQLLYQLS
jgi:hypothetical protein